MCVKAKSPSMAILLYVLPVVFMESFATSLLSSIIPVMLEDTFHSDTYLALGIADSVKGLLIFTTSPFFGKLSDHFGRRPFILITLLGASICPFYLIFFNNLYGYLVLRGLNGMFSSTLPLMFAYMNEFYTTGSRASAYGKVLTVYALSFSIGALVGGSIPDVSWVLYISSIICACNLAYTLLVLPKNPKIPPPNTAEGDVTSARLRRGLFWNPLQGFKLCTEGPLRSRIAVICLIFHTMSYAVQNTTLVYGVLQFSFGSVMVGFVIAQIFASTTISNGILLGISVKLIGEKRSVQVGLLGSTLGCIILGLAHWSWLYFIAISFNLLSGLVYPCLISLISYGTDRRSHGEVVGALGSFVALGEALGPIAFGPLMRVFEGRQVPGTPYLIIAGGIFISFVLSLYIPNPHDENSDVADLFGPNVYSSDSKEGLLQGDSDEVNIVKLFPEVSVDISARATPAPL